MWFTLIRLYLSIKTKVRIFSLSSFQLVFNNFYFGCKKCIFRFVVSPDCGIIQRVRNIKQLGIVMNENIKWKEHVKNVKQYVYMSLRKFYLFKYTCLQYVLRTTYFAIINSKLQYSLSCWGDAYSVTLNPLLAAQKSIIRRISYTIPRTFHSFPLYKTLIMFSRRHLYVSQNLVLNVGASSIKFPSINFRIEISKTCNFA